MNGPQHYRKAEQLLSLAHGFAYGDHSGTVEAHTCATALAVAAQTHATLALAAATVGAAPEGMDADVADEWQAVIDPAPVEFGASS